MELFRSIFPNITRSQEQAISTAMQNVEYITSFVPSRSKESEKQGNDEQVPKTSTEYLVYNKLEAIFDWLQPIILWHNPVLTIVSLIALAFIEQFLSLIMPSTITAIAVTLFLYNLIIIWFRHVWPEIRVPISVSKESELILDIDRFASLHPELLTLEEFCDGIQKVALRHWTKLAEIRQKNRLMFSSMIICPLAVLAILGNHSSDNLVVMIHFIRLSIGIVFVYKILLSRSMRFRLKKAFLQVDHLEEEDEMEAEVKLNINCDYTKSRCSPPEDVSLNHANNDDYNHDDDDDSEGDGDKEEEDEDTGKIRLDCERKQITVENDVEEHGFVLL